MNKEINYDKKTMVENRYQTMQPAKQQYLGLSLSEKESEKPNCLACSTAGQLCSQHLKSDKTIMSLADLLGGTTAQGVLSAPNEQMRNYHQMQAVYAAAILDQLPQQFVMTKQMLEKIALYHAQQGGLSATKPYTSQEKNYAYNTGAKSKGYLAAKNAQAYSKN